MRPLAGRLPEPEEIARTARRRGLGLVTITDLNTIEGCLRYRDRHPDAADFIVSEEVVAHVPGAGGAAVQVLLYDIDERRHREAQRLRRDLFALLAWAEEEDVIAVLGPFPSLLGARGGRIAEVLTRFTRFEIRHGAEGRTYNTLVARLVHETGAGRRIGLTGGSGAARQSLVGRSVTTALAPDAAGFVRELRALRTWASGEPRTLWAAGAGWMGALAPPPGPPAWPHLWRRAALTARLRRVRRGLDREDVASFQRKARSLHGGAGAAAGGSGAASSAQ